VAVTRLRHESSWILAAVLLTAGCASSAGSANGDGVPANGGGGTVAAGTASGGSAAAESFDAFLAGVSAATYQDYANEPGARVRDSSAFQQMRAYLLDRYRNVRVAGSFTDAGGSVFDCVQQSTAASGTTDAAGGCPAGSIPMRRITLSDLVRFPTLQEFFSKSPGGTGQLPLPPSSPSRGS
jgi:hypothetical protein